MKWDYKIVVLLVEWSSFWGGLEAGFYCTGMDELNMEPAYKLSPTQTTLSTICITSSKL